MSPPPNDEFFIGWQGRAPAAMGRRLRVITLVLAGAAMVFAAVFAAAQGTIGQARWEWGNVRTFEGVLVAAPAPILITDEPDPTSGASTFLLVDPLKFGFDPAKARALHLRRVRLEASLLHRGGDAMLEVVPESVMAMPELCGEPPIADLGPAVLVGEIVDSKCWLGAMNPGMLKPHRACAIRCLAGGIPPAFVVRDRAGVTTAYLLVGSDGRLPGDRILDFVAEPVQIAGRVSRLGGVRVLHADASTIARLH